MLARLWQFPSLSGRDPKLVKVFKFVFEVIAKLLVNWWALALICLGQKTHGAAAQKSPRNWAPQAPPHARADAPEWPDAHGVRRRSCRL